MKGQVVLPDERPGAADFFGIVQGLADSPGFLVIPSMAPLVLLVLRRVQTME